MADRDRWDYDPDRARERSRGGGGGGRDRDREGAPPRSRGYDQGGAGSSGYGPGGSAGREQAGYLGDDEDARQDPGRPRGYGPREEGPSYGREEYGRDGYEGRDDGWRRGGYGRDYGRYGSGGGGDVGRDPGSEAYRPQGRGGDGRRHGPGPRPERDLERERERARGIPEAGEGAYGRGFIGNQGRGFGYGPDQRSREFERAGGGNATSTGQDQGPDRSWWERATDEVASWLGDEPAEQRRQADHRGRGPRGYKRSDERIKEDVSDRLADDPHVDASEIDVAVSGGEVTLEGTVESREARRRAEDLAEAASGVTHVQNNLRVRRAGGGPLPANG